MIQPTREQLVADVERACREYAAASDIARHFGYMHRGAERALSISTRDYERARDRLEAFDRVSGVNRFNARFSGQFDNLVLSRYRERIDAATQAIAAAPDDEAVRAAEDALDTLGDEIADHIASWKD